MLVVESKRGETKNRLNLGMPGMGWGSMRP